MMAPVRHDLPSGTVTFLFTDVEGSTKLLHERGAAEYAKALAEHRRILREAFRARGGVEVDTQGGRWLSSPANQQDDALPSPSASSRSVRSIHF
jgi:class 3 adenylate cyclase